MRSFTFNLPDKLAAQLAAAARRDGVDKSTIVRQALEERVRRGRSRRSRRAYDLVKDLCGSVKGPADLLKNSRYMNDLGS